jgi:hypothetical protein
VDVTNHNAKVWFDRAANSSTDAVRMVERFTLIDRNIKHDQVTIDDRLPGATARDPLMVRTPRSV